MSSGPSLEVIEIFVALIPPRGFENFALESNFHLALALPDLMARKTYGGMYARVSRLGDMVVMDNGAAEGSLVSDFDLLAATSKVAAHEVVAPDVLCNAEATVKRTRDFLATSSSQLPTNVMAVAQGSTIAEFRNCVDRFADMGQITTIGIPRHMITTLDKTPARIDFATWITSKHAERFQMHFLGTNPSWIKEVKAAAKYTAVRSVDTSLPFNYALADVLLSMTNEVIHRPTGYFTRRWEALGRPKLIRQNVETFMSWADSPSVVRHQVNV